MNLSKIKSGYKTPFKFLSSTLFLYGITLISSFVTYRYVAPEYLGIWATFTTFTTIATFARLGIVNGMNRELPFYLGRGETDKAYSKASTTLFYTIVNIALMLVIGIIFFFCFDFEQKGEMSGPYKYAALVFFFNIVVEPYTAYLTGTFRTSDNFNKLSNTQYMNGWYRLLSISFVVVGGYYGYLIRELVGTILGAALLHYYRPIKDVVPKLDFKILKQLFVIGINIFLVSYISGFVDTFPRLYIIQEGTTRDLGLFSPVLIVLGIVALIPNTISSYLYPKFSYAYGEGCSPVYFWDKMKFVLAGSVGLGILAFAAVYFLLDYVIPLFPKYTDSASYMKIASLGMAFVGYKLCNLVCVVMKLYKWMWIQPLLYIMSQVGALFVLHWVSDDALWVSSYSLVITNLLMFIFSTYILYRVTHPTKHHTVKQ